MKLLVTIPMLLLVFSCGTHQNKNEMSNYKKNKNENPETTLFPRASQFVTSPLRNRIILELNATVDQVWALVGKLERMPEYSSGLRKVDAEYNFENECTRFTCYFYPMEEGGPETTHSEPVTWYKPNVGLASVADEPNDLGLLQSLGLLTLQNHGNKTILKWDVHFNTESKEMTSIHIEGYKKALNEDIAQNLIKIFGGKVLENYAQKL